MSLYEEPKLPEERLFLKKIAIIFIILLMVSVVTLVFLIGLKAPPSSTQDGSVEFAQATQVFTPGQDMTIEVPNVIVFVPKNATGLDGKFSIIRRQADLVSAIDGSQWSRPLVVNVEYLNSDGVPYRDVNFSTPIQICFKLNSEQWQDYLANPKDYLVQYYADDKTPPLWENLAIASNSGQSQLCGLSDHLSLFALAIWTEGGAIPITGSTPTPGLAPYAP